MNLFLGLLLWFLIVQIGTIIHEFGHALPALLFTSGDVVVHLGKGKVIRKIKIKRLIIQIKEIMPTVGFVNFMPQKNNRFKTILIFLGGPLLTLIFAIIQHLISGRINYELLSRALKISSYYFYFVFFVTIIPITYPNWWIGYSGHKSDGYYVLNLTRKKIKEV